jgi:hypothetical protein
MTDKLRIKLAAGVTALFLAGISVAGLAVRDQQPQTATTPQPAVATAAPAPAGATFAGDDRFEGREDDE